MEAIKQRTTVKNGSISLNGLDELNDQKVEVTVAPIRSRIMSAGEQKVRLLGFKGTIESGFTDTSLNIDRLLYGD